MIPKFYRLTCFALIVLISACSKPNDYSNPDKEIVREFRTFIATTNINDPAAKYKNVSDMFQMQVYNDSTSLRYDVYIDSLNYMFGGSLKNITINLGDPLTDDGAVILELTGRHHSNNSTGILDNLRRSLIDTILNDNIDKYVNITTTDDPNGFMRGQLNKDMPYTSNVLLLGSNVIPAVPTSTTGIALFRLVSTSNSSSPARELYYKINIKNNDPTDSVVDATINRGRLDNPGPIFLELLSNGGFNQSRSKTLTEEEYASLIHDTLFVNVTSVQNKNGKLRGRLR